MFRNAMLALGEFQRLTVTQSYKEAGGGAQLRGFSVLECNLSEDFLRSLKSPGKEWN